MNTNRARTPPHRQRYALTVYETVKSGTRASVDKLKDPEPAKTIINVDNFANSEHNNTRRSKEAMSY